MDAEPNLYLLVGEIRGDVKSLLNQQQVMMVDIVTLTDKVNHERDLMLGRLDDLEEWQAATKGAKHNENEDHKTRWQKIDRYVGWALMVLTAAACLGAQFWQQIFH